MEPRNRAERRLLASNRYKDPLGLSVLETANRLNSSKSTVYRLLRRGLLRAKKRGASTIVIPDSIDEYEAALPDAVFASEEIATAA
jgi:excisionase family DNA binding protein